jgi:predicted MPP superfamily phosphohydrolase
VVFFADVYFYGNSVLIGPHTSNIISEIVLIAIDYELDNKDYKYTRHVDDYSCFVETHEKTEQFLLDLSSELKKYELTLNHKKTVDQSTHHALHQTLNSG